MIVIGDSHVRTFCYSDFFVPLFVDTGKKLCYISKSKADKAGSTLIKTFKSLEKNSDILFVTGEPDTRWCLGKGWQPWNEDQTSKGDITKSAERFEVVLKQLLKIRRNISIFNVSYCQRFEQNIFVEQWNHKVKTICKRHNINFIDTNRHLEVNEIGKYYDDPVHLNKEIIPLVFKEFDRLKIPYSHKETTSLSGEEIKKKFKFNKRFRCYTFND